MTVRQADIPITDEDLVKIASQSTAQRNEVEDRGLAYLYPKLSFFFDGTGNNLYQELAKPPQERALSNVAKLFRAAIDDKSQFKKIIPTYIPGVGTPFSVKNPLPHFGTFPDDTGGVAGLGLGAGGDMRIRFALMEFKRIMTQEFSPYSWCDIQHISLSVFGFSRGATAARAFVRRLLKEDCGYDAQGHLVWRAPGPRNLRLKIDFMGLFDTVASVGGPGWHLDWGAQLAIPPDVKRCVHFVAAHEVRKAFPLDSVRVGASYPANCEEVVYPGVHSDVGGGYAPGYQGRSHLLARIPLRHMYAEALRGGVLLQHPNKLEIEVRDEFSLNPVSPTEQAYLRYRKHLPAAGNDVEALIQAHRVLHFMWRGGIARSGKDERVLGALSQTMDSAMCKAVAPATDDDHPQCDPKTWNVAQSTDSHVQGRQLLAEHRRLAQQVVYLRNPTKPDPVDSRAPRIPMQRTPYEELILSGWDSAGAAVAAIDALFANAIHDSVAHFTSWPCTLYDLRGIYCDSKQYFASHDDRRFNDVAHA